MSRRSDVVSRPPIKGDRVRIIDYSEAHGDTGIIFAIQANGLILVELDEGCIWPVTAREITRELENGGGHVQSVAAAEAGTAGAAD